MDTLRIITVALLAVGGLCALGVLGWYFYLKKKNQ